MAEITDYDFFAITANAAITAVESITAEVLAKRGIDRSQWPKPWPLVEYNPHATLSDVVVRTALALVGESNEQLKAFTRGWVEWMKRCPDPLISYWEIEDRTGKCICSGIAGEDRER